ncbi:MAG: cupin domain-containing protein [Candidatus Marinimicrobia bacterium]|nr:cupin domain-containing protein [Candidatus Neomarinimicrobiota bacterium]MCF7880146.1 cupin domain-containing protein [Candidatus Neomarinimicrobiota bacterium]
MPLIKQDNQNFPEWSEVRHYRILHLDAGERSVVSLRFTKAALFVVEGSISYDKVSLSEGGSISFGGRRKVTLVNDEKDSIVLIVQGDWGEEIGGAGVFSLESAPQPKNDGDPVEYERNTDFDNHFHDCNECWFIIKGSGKVVTEGNRYSVESGDCVLTKRGEHHDFPLVFETIRGVYFETTLHGEKRLGHLYAK